MLLPLRRGLRRLQPRARTTSAYNRLLTQYEAVVSEKEELARTYKTWVPPGHFYSPHPDQREISRRADKVFDTTPPRGIDVHEEFQLELLDEIAAFADDMPFPAEASDAYRYYFNNPAYSWSDAIILHTMLRRLQPQRIVEVGSGYSSAMTLDTIEGWLPEGVEFTCIDPYADLLRSLMHTGDESRVDIVESVAQDVSLDRFTSLEAGDVLFIDSTHVVKAASDVNFLFFEVLPVLNDGVWIHVHDIFYPFEYPLAWLHEGRAWQEIYLLRAFLMFNQRFRVRWFQQYMWARHRELLEAKTPDMANNPGGNIWLQKMAAHWV